MPYSGEHSCRLEDPAQYDSFARKNCHEKHDEKCIDVIFGIKDNKSEIQALRYDKKVWTEDSARAHCKSREGTFEPASEESKASLNRGDLKMKWYEIKAKSDISEIWLYEEIGLWGIGAKEFIAELNAIKSPRIDMHINSPGGEVFDGNAIYNAIKRHPASVMTYIDGIAASIASVIALAGEKVIMAENALYMMHNPNGLVIGTAEDMRKLADILDKIKETMVGVYMEKSGKSDSEIKTLLDAETWMSADEARAAGFVDEIGDEMDMAACAKFIPVMAKMGYKHIPSDLSGRKGAPSARDLERILRDAGCSSKQAKTILAKGYSDNLRDEDIIVESIQADDVQRDVDQSKPITNDDVQDLLMTSKLMRSQK